MAVNVTKRKDNLESKIHKLNEQLSGKQAGLASRQGNYISIPVQFNKDNLSTGSLRNQSLETSSDTIYLHQSLTKIALFSTLAIGSQLLLFFLTRSHIININL